MVRTELKQAIYNAAIEAEKAYWWLKKIDDEAGSHLNLQKLNEAKQLLIEFDEITSELLQEIIKRNEHKF